MRRAPASASRASSPASSPARRALRDGDVVDDTYRVSHLIAAGGMGEVYEVVHTRLERAFALKCLRAEALGDPRASQLFLREVRSLAGVRSEHVVAINDCGELGDGRPYLVMERLHGRNLRELLKEAGQLVPTRAVALIADACLGLDAVHDMGLIHRDLKPENLYVRHRDSGEETCTVLDFGIATRPGNNSTRRESLLGTLRYMAPEQIADSTRVGAWTDVYALGAILYECLSGGPPHQAETETELMFKIMNADVAPLASVEGVSRELSAVVVRALARDPAKRYQSVEELSLALGAFRRRPRTSVANESLDTRPIDVAPRAPSRRSYALLGGTALASFVLGWSLSPRLPRIETSRAPVVASAPVSTVSASGPRSTSPSRSAASTPELPRAISSVPAKSPAVARTSGERRRQAPEAKERVDKQEHPGVAAAALPEFDPSPYRTSP